MLTITLPVPPSANALYTAQDGRRRLTREARAWRTAAALAMRAATGARGLKHVAVVICANVDYRRDLGNIPKLVHDALTASGVIADDRWIDLAVETRSPVSLDKTPLPRGMLTLTCLRTSALDAVAEVAPARRVYALLKSTASLDKVDAESPRKNGGSQK